MEETEQALVREREEIMAQMENPFLVENDFKYDSMEIAGDETQDLKQKYKDLLT